MHSSLLATQTGHSHLRRLILLRCVAILMQLAVLGLAYRFLSPQFPWPPMLGAVGVLILVTILSWWRLSLNRPIASLELFLQLSVDVLVLSVLLYFGGGSTNPFVSLYLLPLVIAAVTLSRRHTWAMAALTLACYSLLMVWYVPLPGAAPHNEHSAMQHMEHAHHQHAEMMEVTPPSSPLQDAFNTHVLGMWLGFVISALVIAYFSVEMARAVRSRDIELTRFREETLRNERIVALGTQAASAAHELGTPLSTMSVVIGELRHDSAQLPALQAELDILDEQVRNCKRILDSLLVQAQETPTLQSPEAFLHDVLQEWQLLRPSARFSYQSSGVQPAPLLRSVPALRSALLNLLNNAADASPEGMEISLSWTDKRMTLEIRDHGPGLTPEAARHAGSAFYTTKQEGKGLGLFLANATLEQLGGSVRLYNREGSGANTEVVLPLQQVAA